MASKRTLVGCFPFGENTLRSTARHDYPCAAIILLSIPISRDVAGKHVIRAPDDHNIDVVVSHGLIERMENGLYNCCVLRVGWFWAFGLTDTSLFSVLNEIAL